MRFFTLVNGAGESCSITEKSLFFHDPAGLGFERSDTYRQVGDRWVRVNRKRKQKQITGKVALFGDDPYLTYFNFVQFLNKEPLTLLYTPNNEASATLPSGTTYRMDVDVTKMDKSEMTKQGYLDCSISFTPKTPWYKYTAISNGVVEPDNILKWGITWGIEWGPLDEFSKGIKSDSVNQSPSRLTVYGPIVNPSWRHYVNGVLFETGKVNFTIGENEYLLVDNTTDPYRIQRRSAINNTLISDLYEQSDFSTKRFVTIQNGNNVIAVTGDNAESPLVKLEAYIYYESV